MSENVIAGLVVISLAVIIPSVILFLSYFLGGRKYSERKLETYEVGLPKVYGNTSERFSIKFYLIAILFIIFDIETVFMYPWAVNFRELGFVGFFEMVLFILILIAGFVYIIKKGVLKEI